MDKTVFFKHNFTTAMLFEDKIQKDIIVLVLVQLKTVETYVKMKPFGNSNGQREKKSFKDKLINMCVDLSKNSQNVINNFLLYVI